MDKRVKQLVSQIKGYLIKIYGEKIKQVIKMLRIIIYGSYVRGEATKDSDNPY
jgi:predicted nucleotidyltransferase